MHSILLPRMKQETFYPSPNGDEDNGKKYLGAAWALVVAATFSTGVRIWVRGRLTRNMGWDDYHMIIGQFVNLVGLGLVTAQVFNGLGRHMYYLQPDQRRRFHLISWLDWMQTFIAIMFTKISICYFLLRIKNDKSNKIFMYSLIGANVLVTALSCFLFLGICRPVHAYWDVGVEGNCFSKRQIQAIVAAQGGRGALSNDGSHILIIPPPAFSVLSDLILATSPLFFLRKLQISTRTKLLLCVLMGIGYITAGCSLTRTILSDRVLNPDITWSDLTTAAWRATEVNLGIICANAPIARPLYLWSKGRLRVLQTSATTELSGTPTRQEKNWSRGSAKRFWPWSKGQGNSRSQLLSHQKLKDSEPSNQPTDTTLTSVEMGLPIQGYMMKDGKRHSHWIDLQEAKREVDQARDTAGGAERVPPVPPEEALVRMDRNDVGRLLDQGPGAEKKDWTTRERLENEKRFQAVRKGAGGS
ncbi:MAG: hypothetical protein Q9178_006736 [Gyalolechia marmorata]